MKAVKRFFLCVAIILAGSISCVVVLGQIPDAPRVITQTFLALGLAGAVIAFLLFVISVLYLGARR